MQKAEVALDKNYFELFNLAPSFSIAMDALGQSFKSLQAQVHPDRFANATEAEKRFSVQLSSHINQAYQTLRNPLERAKYLLHLLRGEQQPVQNQTIRDPAFLMQQMELREALEEVDNATDPVSLLLQMDDEITKQIKDLYNEFEKLLGTGEIPDSDLSQATDIVNRLQFLHKLQAEIDDKQHHLR